MKQKQMQKVTEAREGTGEGSISPKVVKLMVDLNTHAQQLSEYIQHMLGSLEEKRLHPALRAGD